MTWQEYLGSVALIAAAMGLLSLLELAVPLFARDTAAEGRAPANLALSALALLLNWALGPAAAVVAAVCSVDESGLLASFALPAPALVALSVVILDLSTYLAHRSMHAVPLLWRAHRVHHSDPFLDVSTTLRQHPIEGLWRFLWIIAPTWWLGLPLSGLVVYRLLSAIQAVFEHANIRSWQPLDRLLSFVWCTPNMHKIHHSRAHPETDSNYGNLLALFDRGLRTFTPSHRALAVRYGLDDVDPNAAKSVAWLMALPFRVSGGTREARSRTQTTVSTPRLSGSSRSGRTASVSPSVSSGVR